MQFYHQNDVEMRRRHKLEKRAIIVDTDKGLLILPVPRPEDEKGSLKALFDKMHLLRRLQII